MKISLISRSSVPDDHLQRPPGPLSPGPRSTGPLRLAPAVLSGLLLLGSVLLGSVLGGCNRSPVGPAKDLPPDRIRDGKIVLGSPSLTAGIPGAGPLTVREIEDWLDNERNHQPLDFVLPAGLHEAAAEIQLPPDQPLTRARIELGRQLFFDKRLSRDATFACATCHIPEQGYSAHLVMPEIGRNASVSFNRILGSEHFWDGRAESLEKQPESPLKNPFEMNTTFDEMVKALESIEGYRLQFKKIYGEVSLAAVGSALAAFQRSLVTEPTAWDALRILPQLAARPEGSLSAAEQQIQLRLRRALSDRPVNDAAKRGREIFYSDRARCAICHTGPNLTDEQYHNLGVGLDDEPLDPGRFEVTRREEDRGAFKTPTLRNLELTAPYMHNGQFETLEQVVDFFVAGGRANEQLDPLLEPIDLSPDEREDLVEFLKSLQSELPPVETGRLPE